MTVRELVKFEKSGAMYRLIDATKRGYMTTPSAIIEGDTNIVKQFYGDAEVVGFSATGKNKIAVYVIAE